MKKIHFVGIKGVGMTALAIYAKEKGLEVTGSDVSEKFLTDTQLAKFSIPIYSGFDNTKKIHPDLIVTTGAHGGFNNPEVKEYESKNIEILSHGQALGRFMDESEGISVCGVGGKTTTSAMIATILTEAKKDPSYCVGVAEIFTLGQPGHFGKGKFFVAEADEYATSPGIDPTPRFMYQHPQVIVVTNIEYDHPDVYANLEETMTAFCGFTRNLKNDGFLVVYNDSKNNQEFQKKVDKKIITYGLSRSSNYIIENIRYFNQTTEFELINGNISLGKFKINIPGKFNVLNATAAIVTCYNLGINIQTIIKGLNAFFGTKRRFELVGQTKEIKIYDDYAHHPSEIKNTLLAIKEWYPEYKTVCIFQPHTYSRTKALFNDFAQCFGNADQLFILPIFSSAREKDDPSISSNMLVSKISQFHQSVTYVEDEKKLLPLISKISEKTIIVTMGAGDVYKIGPLILRSLNE